MGSLACSTAEVPHVYFWDWGVTQTDRWGMETGEQKNRSTLNLKPLELLVFIKSTNQIGYGALRMIPSHQFKKLQQHSLWGRRWPPLHIINMLMLLGSLCRPTLRKGPSSVRSAKPCSAPPSLYSVTYSSTIVSMSVLLLVHNEYIYPRITG